MRILILGCSHSAGAWKKNLLNERIWYDAGFGWPSYLARNYPKIDFECYAHPAGGVINYLTTVGHLYKTDKMKEFDGVIIQYTEELRVTIYNLPNCDPEKFVHPKKLKNLNVYDYANKSHLKKMYQVHNPNYVTEHILKDIEISQEQKDNLLKSYLEELCENPFSEKMIQDLKFSLECLFDRDKLFTFEWSYIKDEMTNIRPNLYETISDTVDGHHLDRYGNKIVYEILENPLDEFLRKNEKF